MRTPGPNELPVIQRAVVRCRRCPELRSYCRTVAETGRRSAYREETYWGRPVPAFGDEQRGGILLVGLAPAAHGANRTGRMFTGDRSGDFLFAGLHRVGLASQAGATHRDDGLTLRGVFISASLRCAPPGNKPTTTQLERCRPFLVREIAALDPGVIVCLGGIAWTSTLRALEASGIRLPRPRPKFGHGAEVDLAGRPVLGSYHVSQQNTFTGRLTESMLDTVLERARTLAGGT